MKKIIALALTIAMLLSLVACGTGSTEPTTPIPSEPVVDNSTTVPTEGAPTVPEDTTAPTAPADTPVNSSYDIDLTGVTTLDELETRIEEHLTTVLNALNGRWEAFAAEIDTYEKYVANAEKVAEFYESVITETEQMCIMLYEYSAAYARMILDSDMSADDKYDAIDGINDILYDDACDEIHDEIYEGILDEMNDYFYSGILEDAQDDVDYSDWYDVCSKEYSQWYDTASEVYSLYYDAASEIYSFYYDMASELYGRDYERAEKVYARFLEKIAKAKGQNSGNVNTNATFDTNLRTAGSVEELESVVDAHVNECVQALWAEWAAMSTEIDTFEEYLANIETVEAFHAHVVDSAAQIFVMICDYGIVYSELVLQSNASTKDMYKAFEDFKDCIYEDACEIVKDEIYEDLLNEIKDYYYEGIINDARDSVKYSDWSDARGDAYSWWSDARGDVYSNWSDTRGDLYSYYSDIRSELYGGDLDGANDELQDFKDKVNRMR